MKHIYVTRDAYIMHIKMNHILGKRQAYVYIIYTWESILCFNVFLLSADVEFNIFQNKTTTENVGY